MNWRQQQTDQTYAFARKHMTRFGIALDIGCDEFAITGHLAREFQHTHCFDFRDKTAMMRKHVEDPTRVTFHHTALGVPQRRHTAGLHVFKVRNQRPIFTLYAFAYFKKRNSKINAYAIADLYHSSSVTTCGSLCMHSFLSFHTCQFSLTPQ